MRELSHQPAIQNIIFAAALNNCEKSAVKRLMEKPIILNFVNLSTIVGPRL